MVVWMEKVQVAPTVCQLTVVDLESVPSDVVG